MKRLLFLCVVLNIFIDALGGQVVTPGDSIHVNHYNINLTYIDIPAQEISAITTLTCTSLVDNLTVIPLELMELTVDSVFVDGDKVMSYTHEGTELNIPVAEPFTSGTDFQVTVYYQGHPFHENWGGFHWSGDYAFNLGVGFVSQPHNLGKAWFPCVDDFTDRATYDVIATVGEGLTATSGGVLLSKTNDGKGNVTWHWQIQHPMPTYLACIAVGQYELYSDTYQGMERDIPVEIYARPSEIDNVPGSFIHLHEVMDLFEEKFGPYPWHKIGYTGTATGAMEHVGNIAYPHFAINGGLNYESLWVHELSHMWFGDKVTCHEAEEMWVNEGWGKYCENYYTEELYGHDVYIGQMNDINKTILQTIHTSAGDGGYYALDAVPQDITYGLTSYEKGALVIHTLRNHLGDEVFFEAAKHYLNTLAYHDATSEQLRDAFAESAGVDLDGFFDNWVFQPGRPGYVLETVDTSVPGEVTVELKQKGKGRTFLGNGNRIEVAFYDNAMNREVRIFEFDGEWGSMTYDDIPFEPEAVVLDPDHKTMEATTVENAIFKSPGTINFTDAFVKAEVTDPAADSILVYASHYWVAPDPVDPPLEGLTFSDYRYWHIDGIFPETTEGKLHFFYSKAGNLDENLILSSADSLVLFYRKDATEAWSPIPFTQFGPWSVGYLITDEIKKGDYTLAVWDEAYVGIGESKEEKPQMLVYPNPSEDQFTFIIHHQGNVAVNVYSIDGKKVFASSSQNSPIVWDASSIAAGTYTARLVLDGNTIATETLIKSR